VKTFGQADTMVRQGFRQHLGRRISRKPLLVALIGPGGVGCEVLNQLHQVTPRLEAEQRILPQVRVICNSTRMYLATSRFDLGLWREALETYGETANLDRLTSYLSVYQGPVAVIDTTASTEVAHYHREWLRCGFNVLTANKAASSASLEDYRLLLRAEGKGCGSYYQETTVGAGLPIISVLQNIVDTGDEVSKIEGILSGTLSHLCATGENGEPFSATLENLVASGFTEPDPREDLLGNDFLRKLVILARTAGIPIECSDIDLRPFVPLSSYLSQTVSEFMSHTRDFDSEISRLFHDAKKEGKILRFTGSVSRKGRAQIGFAYLDPTDLLARALPGDNLIAIYTRRYREHPLVVQGPGAGREVTAAGILADLLKMVRGTL